MPLRSHVTVIASIIGSGINGNSFPRSTKDRIKHAKIASIIGSGINGNFIAEFTKSATNLSLLLLEVELMETDIKVGFIALINGIASIIGSGINGNCSMISNSIFPKGDLASLLLLEVELMETGSLASFCWSKSYL